ncbi:uncharacterized protein LOC132851733 isoform X1 [Tachysurus vachellii]|uniref:uncharacterized protein LOC132851733 isoform X1 n=1 Tax=Tachysurus vachellii TaxID=175792 RepID=UPI00296AF9B0|nr:uncharacterized protein LOC132851733 isoform X1 [Tachysurus vachellii]XP_060734707.1 uncharacterized protein LOC132851733 isoform X1 [Tachysurus vachellii]
MAENRVRDWNRVRDMYEGVDEHGMTEAQKKAHRDETLLNNPDVLFRIYRKGKLHVLLFMPTDTEEWKKVIQDRIQDRIDADPSVQLTERRDIKGDLPIINMSGPENHLEHICDIFDQLYNQVQENIQNRAAPQRNLVAEIEGLNVRIRKLEDQVQIPGAEIEELNVRIRELEDQVQIPGAEIEELNVRIRELEDQLQILQRQLSEEVRRNATEDEGAEAQNNPEDDVEELRERIRELELENRKLRGLQDD